jgi:hypothetical protein
MKCIRFEHTHLYAGSHRIDAAEEQNITTSYFGDASRGKFISTYTQLAAREKEVMALVSFGS